MIILIGALCALGLLTTVAAVRRDGPSPMGPPRGHIGETVGDQDARVQEVIGR